MKQKEENPISLRAFQKETERYIKTRESINAYAKKNIKHPAFVWNPKKGWLDSQWSGVNIAVRPSSVTGGKVIVYNFRKFYIEKP